MNRILLSLLIFCSFVSYAQDSTKSKVIKNNFTSFVPMITFKYPEFSIADGYYLVKEANEGKAASQHELAIRYLLGKGFEKDTAKAVIWIKRAVEKKLPAACFNYGIMLLNKAGVEWNPFDAYKYFLIAAGKQMPEAQMIIGLFYLDNLILTRNLNKAVEWINKAVKLKYKPAEELLAEVKENEGRFIDLSGLVSKTRDENDNSGSEKDFSFELTTTGNDSLNKAIEEVKEGELLKKSYTDLKKILNIKNNDMLEHSGDTTSNALIQQGIKWGNPEAVIFNGSNSEKGISKNKDLINAASNYFRAYRLGVNRAANLLFKLTTDQAFIELLNKSMDKGNLEAIYVWSAIIALDYNSKFTEGQSIEFLKKASEKGHVQSAIELGLCYYNGRGVEQNREKAIELWNNAAAGSEDAKLRIAFHNVLTKESSSSLKQDYDYLLNAYNKGSLLAQTALAYCYEKGIFVKQNKAEANKYYREAVKRGSETAMNSLKRLYDELRPSDDLFKIY